MPINNPQNQGNTKGRGVSPRFVALKKLPLVLDYHLLPAPKINLDHVERIAEARFHQPLSLPPADTHFLLPSGHAPVSQSVPGRKEMILASSAKVKPAVKSETVINSRMAEALEQGTEEPVVDDRIKSFMERMTRKKPVKVNRAKSNIVLQDVNAIYNPGLSSEVHALKDVNFELYPGEFITIFGPSGSGKSTLLNVIAGLEQPSMGKITVDGKNIQSFGPDELAEYHAHTIGMIFQAYNLVESITVEDNILLPMMFVDEPYFGRKRKIRELMDRFQISDYAKRYPSMLSGGQQQRVGIARSLVNDPEIIIADEPVGNLDSKNTEIVLEILKDLNEKEKKTVILVTHNPDLLPISHRIIFMKDGKLLKIQNNEIRDQIAPVVAKQAPLEVIQLPDELKLLLRTYGGLSNQQIGAMWTPLKARIITEHLTSKFSREQIVAIEEGIKQRIMGIVGRHELYDIFDRPLDEGGASLNKRMAEKMANQVEEILSEATKVMSLIKEADIEHQIFGDQVIDEIRDKLLSHYTEEHIPPESLEVLDHMIKYRIINKLDRAEFAQLIAMPKAKGGAGLKKALAAKLSKELEMIMLIKFGEQQLS